MAHIPKEHRDILGEPVTVGSYVAVSRRNALKVCRVMKLSAVMIHVWPATSPVADYTDGDGWLAYAEDSVVLNSAAALAYILQN